ncbi:winged helix-turn-helix domain-containing protein [Actinoplanes oblitus]|uniref:Winged helix-turn-helix domain-containing protein n=1 Tax=Actinoplanes oblitus TaxID=3040509 RepID=A0ABY8W7L7_9ACTN|nr:winged helix-turn-helix domain-containing protein [Actinoplanes oblitus]WIM93844.1 winged helix-turn-helix domain-containing protein [Actinoplanes oblitus]
MPVSALSPRADRRSAGPGRGSASRRSEPALTVTLAIPLTGDAVSPQAHRLLAAVRELVELSRGTVTVEAAAVPEPEPEPVPSGPEVRLLTGSRQVLLDGEPVPLTRLEFDLLLYLAERPRRVFSRAQLLAGVWGYERAGERTVDVHVRRLRLKLGASVPAVTTVYGVGYRLADDARITIMPHD